MIALFAISTGSVEAKIRSNWFALSSTVMSSGFAMWLAPLDLGSGVGSNLTSAGEHAGLLEQRQRVGGHPALDDAAVGDPDEVAVRAGDERVGRGLVALGDHVRAVDLELQIRHGAAEGLVRLDDRVEALRAPDRVVIDECVAVDECLGRTSIAARQSLDELQHDGPIALR